ncbi:hypothetical protein NPIL_173651 [Nephila pilipes]|uniref:Uncharacterized protein n=1 Tax=Nephila pilipes TaxID=299642 RepID=A0A8X6NXZ6_NEPPI|nr:hypothetical protein NPIL_173651 [Nephila pilipes]
MVCWIFEMFGSYPVGPEFNSSLYTRFPDEILLAHSCRISVIASSYMEGPFLNLSGLQFFRIDERNCCSVFNLASNFGALVCSVDGLDDLKDI